jgi:hypothetical protein
MDISSLRFQEYDNAKNDGWFFISKDVINYRLEVSSHEWVLWQMIFQIQPR